MAAATAAAAAAAVAPPPQPPCHVIKVFTNICSEVRGGGGGAAAEKESETMAKVVSHRQATQGAAMRHDRGCVKLLPNKLRTDGPDLSYPFCTIGGSGGGEPADADGGTIAAGRTNRRTGATGV